MSSHRPASPLRLSGWLLVLAWLAAIPGLMPLLFAAAAVLDGEHGVLVRGSGDEAAVILTHGANNRGKAHEQIHHHRLMGRVLTCCATSPTGQADHVMQFRGTNSTGDERKVTTAPEQGESDVNVPPVVEGSEFVVVLPERSEFPNFALVVKCGALLPQIPGLQHALLI